MTKGEKIEYAINKECSEYSLVGWCKTWGITLEEFKIFLELGKMAFDEHMLYEELIH